MKNILFAPLVLLISCAGTKLMVSKDAMFSNKVLAIERKGIYGLALPAKIFIDNEKVGKIGPKGKLMIPVKEGTHTVKIKMGLYNKKYFFITGQQDTSFLSFRPKLFGIKLENTQ
jgi:hypothetical protein